MATASGGCAQTPCCQILYTLVSPPSYQLLPLPLLPGHAPGRYCEAGFWVIIVARKIQTSMIIILYPVLYKVIDVLWLALSHIWLLLCSLGQH